ncbi:MAG TPA: deoxyguanosinetriphosphate triphosphohydrolase [Candidatus Fimivivens faecavium]|nr:deoxyguanosinetriphosphate triphosphohydrolase [Candidatus Fimivivens faecavium]
MTIREQTQNQERETLSPLAVLSENTRGRKEPIEECDVRTPFQRDRDRILHCKAFRRLKHKTQVFLSPEGDHYRTRLTHTLEVSQIARTVSRALRLNEDLTEAIALGHDLGHTPFGHAGEYALGEVCPHGYKHAEQSVRVVERLENDGKGLNLTWEVRDGIACHTSGTAATLEGRVVRFSDKIAYMNHDFDDAVRAGVLREDDLPWEIKYAIGRSRTERINAFIHSLIENSSDDIRMSKGIQSAYDSLRAFLFETVYTNPAAKSEEGKAKELLKRLYAYYISHPDELPEEYRLIAQQSDIDRAACDYISGMTDRYAVTVYQNLFIPRSWSV